MKPIILYRNDVDWRQEADLVKKYFTCVDSRMLLKDNLVIARFSALPFYQEQERDLKYSGCQMINTYEQHRYIADLGNWYMDLAEFTPRTWNELHTIPEQGPFVLKGETNSKKFLWNTHCFAKDKKAAIEVHGRLLADSMLQYQKIYIRQYVPLEILSEGLQGLPITREYRFFVYKYKILSGGFYWASHSEDIKSEGIDVNPGEVPREFLNAIIEKIQNTELSEPPTYYVIDVAKTAAGEWILIELNEGSMSGLSDNDPDVLYKNLKEELEADGHYD
jgi:ATP-grasp domain, R2K clade family 3